MRGEYNHDEAYNGEYNHEDAYNTVIVWQAEGVLMARYGVSAQDALEMLVKKVTSGEGKVVEVCRTILDEAARG